MTAADENNLAGDDNELDNIIDDTGEDGLETGIGDGDEDQELEGDESEDTEDEGGQDELPLAAGKSRSSQRIQTLKGRATAAEIEAAELRKRLADIQSDQRRPNAAPSEAELRAEAERLEQMDPVDRIRYESSKQIEALKAQISGLGFHVTDSTDKAGFEAKAATDPLYKKYADRVEQSLKAMRSNGANTTREAILTYMIGEDARKRLAQKDQSGQRRNAAANRVANTKGRAVNTRSDASGSGSDKNSVDALEKRLSGVAI